VFKELPKEHRVKIHSTKVLERLNGELGRRAEMVGIFPNESAIRRLVGTLLMEQNHEHAIQERYMSLESWRR
jgi:transposase-like protein